MESRVTLSELHMRAICKMIVIGSTWVVRVAPGLEASPSAFYQKQSPFFQYLLNPSLTTYAEPATRLPFEDLRVLYIQ